MNELYFEKISQFDREAEPVTVSIPFGQGKLTDPSQLVIRDETTALAHQRRVLATWPDGSVKWLLVHLQTDLPGNRDKTLTFDVASTPVAAEPAQEVTVEASPKGILVDTGLLTFRVPREGFLPISDVRLNGQQLWDTTPFKGFVLRHDGEELTTATGPVELTVEEVGPLRAVILVEGKHRKPDGSGYLDLRGRIVAYAGKPYIAVEHQFIHAEEAEELTLQQLSLDFAPAGAPERPQMALGQGYYRTSIETSDDEPLAMALDVDTMKYQSNEHFTDSFYGDFWVDWRDDQGGLTLTLYQAHQNFPKALQVTQSGISADLFPSEEVTPQVGSVPLLRGMAKTHRIQLHFHEPETPLETCSVRSLQFQLPDRPALPRAWFRDNNAWLAPFFPEALPDRLITGFNRLHDGRPEALGMFHFGDAPDAGYTNQGRGRGENVWVNNEYDRPHACALYYALTGQRRVLDSALVSARHWLDVDLCHYDPDPLIHGGLKIHTRYHVTGGVTPSHEWTEGMLDYYVLTGRREGLEGARSVAENILRHLERPRMKEPGATSVREGGWAMRALIGMYIGTGEDRWRDEARKLAELYLDWFESYGGLLAPYTSHSMPRVPFMISLTVNSFARYLLIEEDEELRERIEELIVETVDDLIDHCLGPDGVAYYKELPSLRRTAPTQHFLEALTHAYRITGDRRYLEVATRQFAAMDLDPAVWRTAKYADGSGAVIRGEGGGRIFADKYTSLLLYGGAASELGLLDWYDYPF